MARRNVVGFAGALLWFVACGGAVERGDGNGGTAAWPQGGDATASGGSTSVGVGGAVSGALGGALGSGGSSKSLGGALGNGGSVVTVGGEGPVGGAPGCEGDYVACGCGCCGGLTAPNPTDCYYPDYGYYLEDIVGQDTVASHSPSCANAGCSIPRHYACCMSPPTEPPGTSKYSISFVPATNSIDVFKWEAGGTCAFVQFFRGGEQSQAFKALGNYRWTGFGDYRSCSSSVRTDTAIGMSGYMQLTPNGSSCSISIHAALFTSPGDGSAHATRIDVDESSSSIPVSECN